MDLVVVTPRRAEGKKQFCPSGQQRGGFLWHWEMLEQERWEGHGALLGTRREEMPVEGASCLGT